MIPGGMIAERYGGKHTLGFGMLCSTISTLITPFVVRRANYIGLIVVRVMIGLGQVRNTVFLFARSSNDGTRQ